MPRLFSNVGATDYVLNPYRQQIEESAEILVAAPYVTKAEELVVAANLGKQIKLIAGINECTSPDALRALINLPNCTVRYFTRRFHAKIYIFDQAALIGSSNLTDGGMVSNREATLLVEDSEDVDQARRLFMEMWTDAETLTPDRLEAFAKVYVRPMFPDCHPRFAEALGGHVEPRNINVGLRRPNAGRIFIKQLRRQIYEGYRKAFLEVLEVIREGDYRRTDLQDLGIAYETNRFLNWVRLKKGEGEKWAETPLRSASVDLKQEIERLGREWIAVANTEVPEDYTEMLMTAQRVFGSAESIDKASKEEFSSGLMSIHAFIEQLRFVKGGTKNLVPFFWSENKDDVNRVKKSLKMLIHGNGEFIERLHDLIYDPEWWLNYFGLFCALELFGTIKPQELPPLNGRMAKALRYIGYNVKTS